MLQRASSSPLFFPFGYFECLVLPQGIKPATDIFQARMVGIFASMRENRPLPYLDDIFHYKGNSFQESLQILDEIFGRLEKAGMQVNLSKSSIMGEEVELLGFQLTRTGVRPTAKRIEAILKLAPPKNKRGCRRIIGIVNFIKNHIPGRAGLMRHLTDLTKKDVDFHWGAQENQAFKELRAAVNNLMSIPIKVSNLRQTKGVAPTSICVGCGTQFRGDSNSNQ